MSLRLITLGTSKPDAGTPVGNTFYAIDQHQDLRWYKYLGTGQPNPAPGNANWHPNSGNPIGNGWGSFMWMQLGTGGTFVAIRDNGGLYWYRYLGAGETDVGGSLSWEFGSGTEIGQGWQNFRHVLMYYNNGDHLILLAVQADGTMRAYFYTHGQGWHTGSGDAIGHGWNGFQRLIGTTSTIFGVTDNSDLRWYQFVEHGWPRPPGEWPLKPNSGNVIGTGWAFAHLVVGGFDNTPSTSPTLCGVDTAGNVRWYRYRGSGGPETSADWHPNSGSVISGSW